MDNWTTLRIFAFKSVIIYNEKIISFLIDNELFGQCMYLSIIVIIVSVPVRKAGQVIHESPQIRGCCVVMFDMRGMIYGTPLLEW